MKSISHSGSTTYTLYLNVDVLVPDLAFATVVTSYTPATDEYTPSTS